VAALKIEEFFTALCMKLADNTRKKGGSVDVLHECLHSKSRLVVLYLRYMVLSHLATSHIGSSRLATRLISDIGAYTHS
jgi:hypothetical protein